MPNNPEYADRYNIVGKVVFSAVNATVPITEETVSQKGNNALIANFLRKSTSSLVWAINKNEEYGEGDKKEQPGSIFIPNWREVRPFEAFATNSFSNAPSYLSLNHDFGEDNYSTGIYDILKSKYSSNDVNADVKVYNLSGNLVICGKRVDIIKRLPKGVYIVNGKKMIVK